MLNYQEAMSRIARIAELERQALDLVIFRAQLGDQINKLYSECSLDLAPVCALDSELTSLVWKTLREDGGEYPNLLRQDREAQARHSELLIEIESLRWELTLNFACWSESAMPLGALLGKLHRGNKDFN